MAPRSRGDVGARGKARKRALDVLFEADVRRADPLALLADRVGGTEDQTLPEYAVSLVEGVVANRQRLDALIVEHAVGWTLDRMPAVDRNVLRLGVYELLYADDVPDGVAISEAVRLARDLSTDDSPGFVNGLLSAVLSHRS